MKKQKLLCCTMAVALILLSSCTQAPKEEAVETQDNSPSQQQATVLLLRYTGTREDYPYLAARYFAKLLEERSDGRLSVELMAESELGFASDAAHALIYGTVSMHFGAPLYPLLEDLSWTALSVDIETLELALAGPLRELLEDECQSNGVTFLGLFSSQYYSLAVREPITTSESLEGAILASTDGESTSDIWDYLGAGTIHTSYEQIYALIQQDMAWGREDVLRRDLPKSLAEFLPYLLQTEHRIDQQVMYISTNVMQQLGAEQQDMIRELAEETQSYIRELVRGEDEKILEAYQQAGGQIFPSSSLIESILQAEIAVMEGSWELRYGQEGLEVLYSIGAGVE